MGRLADFIALLIVILLMLTLQFVGGQMLDPMRDEMLDSGIDSSYDANDTFQDMYAAITKWVPMTGILGSIIIVVYREYRRQQITATRPGVRP